MSSEQTGSKPVEVACPKCKEVQIVYLPLEQMPKCPVCNGAMIIKEVLTEGKSY